MLLWGSNEVSFVVDKVLIWSMLKNVANDTKEISNERKGRRFALVGHACPSSCGQAPTEGVSGVRNFGDASKTCRSLETVSASGSV
jgi:hypothetical protein